ncbi:sulfotransferase 1E1-like [Littorina saxatilis]
MKEQLDCIRALEMREDDVIICAFPKSGTHWLWEVSCMLLTGKAEYETRAKEQVMLEAAQIQAVEQMTSPRVLNTHVPASMLPKQVKDKRVKVIHVYRNVKDVFTSLYFHFKQHPKREHLTLESLFTQSYFSPNNYNGNYFASLKTMDSFIKDNPDIPVFNVSFEDTKKDPVNTVSRLGEFLGVEASPELCADIARATSFSNMQQADTNKHHPQHMPPVRIYRKGEVGDWTNHLTVAQSERLDMDMKKLKGCSFSFTYTL